MLSSTHLFLGVNVFMPHGHCYLWQPELVGLHVVADALIALAYYSIPLTLFYFVRKRQDLPFISIFLLFSAFIVACGTTHLMEIWTLWHPTYWLSGIIKLLTAIVSGITAVLLVPIVPKALALPSSADLESANLELEHEVAECKRIEEELIRSRDLREAIFNESTDALFLVDAQTLLTLDCNRRAVKLFEAHEKAELIGIEGHLLQRYQFSQDDLDEIAAEMQLKGFWSRELEYTTLQGNSFWGNIAAKPIAVSGGSMNLVRVTDISDRKRMETEREQAEQALKISEARYRAIVEDQTELIARFQPDGTLMFVNDAYCRYFGVNREDLIGHHYEPVVFVEDRERIAQQVRSISQDNPTVVIENRVVVGGEVRWTQWSNRAFFDVQGNLKEFQAVGRDIHDLKQAEEAVRQSDRRFRAIFNTMFQFIGLLTPEGILLEANQTALEFAGLTHDDVINRPFWEAHWWGTSAETQTQLKAAIAQAATGQFIRYEVDVLGVGDTVTSIDFSLKPVQDETGKVVLLIPEGRDISDRKRIEESLRQSEERWQLAISGSNDGIWDHNLRTNEHYLSPRCIEISGYEYDEIDTFDKWLQHVHPDDVDRLQTTFQMHIRQRLPNYACEYRIQCKDGNYKWLLARGKVLWDEHGNSLRAVGSLTDIHDRKRSEEALRQYERIVSATTDAILLLDRNYVYQVVNQAYLNWHDKQLNEVVGHSVRDILSPQVFDDGLKSRLDQCLAGQVVQYEMWMEFPSLGAQFLSVTYDPYFDSNRAISGVVVSLRNITRLKQAEMELELQSIIVRNMAEGVCMVKVADGMIVYTNPKFEHMFGYEPGELKDQNVSIVNYEDDNLSAEEVTQLITQNIIQHGEATYEVHNVKKDGTPFWCRATTSIFQHPEHGSVMVAVQQDITEQKRANDLLKASLKEKEVLLKEIHHRVKNNLGIIDGLLQMQARRSRTSEVTETLKDSQSRIASIALVHEKLYCSEDLANIDFCQYILDLTAHLFGTYNTHANRIRLITQVDNISLDIDTAIPCGLIINELVSNALKYAFPHETIGEIHIKFCKTANKTIILTVQDNGIGLPQDFDLQKAKTLGLKLIQGLVSQLNGTLEINNQSGATFRITINQNH